MTAVLDKPRAKAKPKAEKSTLQARLDKIFAKLKLGQEKLQLAHHSVGLTDPGDAPEILLRAVTEDMLPPAIAPMYRQPLTRADVDAAYTGMFTSLAAIDGVIALSLGQVIEDTLRDAWALLDEANSLMDFTDMKDALPEAQDFAHGVEATAATTTPTDEVSGLIFDAYERTSEAHAILDSHVSEMNNGAAYGARSLVKLALDAVSVADETNSQDDCETASGALHEAIEVLELVTDEAPDLVAQGALSLLVLAKQLIDDNVGALP